MIEDTKLSTFLKRFFALAEGYGCSIAAVTRSKSTVASRWGLLGKQPVMARVYWVGGIQRQEAIRLGVG